MDLTQSTLLTRLPNCRIAGLALSWLRINENLRFRFGGLKGGIMGSTSKPTDTQMRQATEIRPVLEKAVQEANALINALPALLKELADAGIYFAPVKPIGQ